MILAQANDHREHAVCLPAKAGFLTLLREYLRQGLIWRSVLSSRSSVSCWKVLTGLSMSLEAAKSRPKPTLPITSKLSLNTYADL